jgi:hypothetical protein
MLLTVLVWNNNRAVLKTMLSAFHSVGSCTSYNKERVCAAVSASYLSSGLLKLSVFCSYHVLYLIEVINYADSLVMTFGRLHVFGNAIV